jgi:hypothetical protein
VNRPPAEEPGWLAVALLGKTRGNRGELTALALTGKPERYQSLREVYRSIRLPVRCPASFRVRRMRSRIAGVNRNQIRGFAELEFIAGTLDVFRGHRTRKLAGIEMIIGSDCGFVSSLVGSASQSRGDGGWLRSNRRMPSCDADPVIVSGAPGGFCRAGMIHCFGRTSERRLWA